VSKSTVSRVCEHIKSEFGAWSARRLDDVRLDYLFLDGSHFKYHASAGAEPVLAAWGRRHRRQAGVHRAERRRGESGDAWAVRVDWRATVLRISGSHCREPG
jgi:transposase-like protein